MPKVDTEVTPQGAELTVDAEAEKLFDGATSKEEIRRIIEEEAAKQNLVIPRDDKGRFAAAPKTEAAAKPEAEEADEPVVFEDDFVIGGKSYHFEGDTPGAITAQVKAAIAAHENATKPQVQTPSEADEAKKKQDEKLSMQLDVMSGKMSIDEYIAKSGAVDDYLKSKGLNTADLKEIVDEKKTNKEVGKWEDATSEFLKAEGNDWPGGDQNLKAMGYKLAELGLTDKPSVESLQKAYDAMKEEGFVFPVEKPAEQVTQQAAPKKKATSSSTFGVGGGDTSKDRKTVATATVPQITDNMSPREIMEAYKSASLAAGIHPDEFLRSQSR